ncbi:MAG TPA: hypothetical protein PLT07_02570 [Trueperaceae bacterium]|nr:hypothetical protein [Trueperaceae bacterium]
MKRSLILASSLWLVATLAFGVAEGVLTFSPNSGPVGTAVAATASGLPANATLDFVWATADARWLVEDGHFYGQDADAAQAVLLSVVTDKDGKASFTFTVPTDFGYVHNTTLVQGEEVVARQGFTLTPALTLSPTSGPLGTPITVTVTGLGFNFYQSGWHLMYDNAQTGWVTGITTQGSATFTIPATGNEGPHLLQLLTGPRRPYLNIEQSPNYQPAMAYHEHATFTITPGQAVTPPDAADQTLPRVKGQQAPGSGPALAVDFASGIVGSPIRLTGVNYPPETTVELSYSSVRGNRISGGGWQTVDVPWGSVKTDAAGGFDVTWPTPDDLAGARTITAVAGGTSATVDYTITPNVEALTPSQVAPGATFQLTLKGTGWSDTGNIYTVVIDNSYFGYACGFNTNGTIVINFTAPLEPGWHYLDLYPSIYQGTSDVPTTTTSNDHFQLPMLNAIDHPGEELPAFHLAFEVVGE